MSQPRKRGRPFGTKGPPKQELRIRLSPEQADWLRSQPGISATVERLIQREMKRGQG